MNLFSFPLGQPFLTNYPPIRTSQGETSICLSPQTPTAFHCCTHGVDIEPRTCREYSHSFQQLKETIKFTRHLSILVLEKILRIELPRGVVRTIDKLFASFARLERSLSFTPTCGLAPVSKRIRPQTVGTIISLLLFLFLVLLLPLIFFYASSS